MNRRTFEKRLSGARVCAALASVLALGLPALVSANILANPGFETGGGSYSGWFTFGSGVQLSTPATDNIFRTGAAASKIYGGFNGCPGSPVFNVGGFGQAFTPTIGNVYELSGYTFVASADPMLGTDTCNKNRLIAKIAFFNAASGGAEIAGNEIVIGDGNTPLDQWLPFSVSIPAPTGALRVEALFLFLQPGCDAGSVFVDDASFTSSAPVPEPNQLANPAFTAGLTGWNPFGNVFTENRAFLVRSPGGSAKLFSTFVAGAPSGIYQSFPATRATGWKFDVHALNTCREDPITGTNDNFATARIVFRDAGNNEIGANEVVIADNGSNLGTWSHYTLTALAPTGTVAAEAYVLFNSPTLLNGSIWVDDLSFYQLDPTGVPVGDGPPQAFQLRQNVPNPFHPATRIDFELLREERVAVAVYDVAGRRVVTLLDRSLPAGNHSVRWDGRRADGTAAATGRYQYVLETAAGRVSRSMTLVK